MSVGGSLSAPGQTISSSTVSSGTINTNSIFLSAAVIAAGGTITVLDYYEEFSSTTLQFKDGATNISVTSTIKIIRVGKCVNYCLFNMVFNDTAAPRTSTILCAAAIPTRFRPSSYQDVMTYNSNGANAVGIHRIGTNGDITIYFDINFATTWAAAGNFTSGVGSCWNLN